MCFVHSGSKLRTGALAMTTYAALPLVGGLQRAVKQNPAASLLSTTALLITAKRYFDE